MCYSALVKEDFRKLEREYGATLDWNSFLTLVKQREFDWTLKVPDGLVQSLIAYDAPQSREIKEHANRFRVAERHRIESEIETVNAEISVLESAIKAKPTKTAQTKLDTKIRKLQKLQQSMAAPSVTTTGGYRIYPMYFAPVIIQEDKLRKIVPMRYRILPSTGVEVPSQYNVFNARRDSLQCARTWKPLFGHKHAIFPFERFFEWVARDGKKIEVSFTPEGYESMWAASLYEEYVSPEQGLIRSFAMVTDEPPPEVSAAGHDRCPVFLEEGLIDKWLLPAAQSLERLDELLTHKQRTYYAHALAA